MCGNSLLRCHSDDDISFHKPLLHPKSAYPYPIVRLRPYLSGKELSFNIDRDPIQPIITVEFRGGAGQFQVRSIEVTVVRSGGLVVTKALEPNVGSAVTFNGTIGLDRVIITVTLVTNQSYRIVDQLYNYNQHA